MRGSVICVSATVILGGCAQPIPVVSPVEVVSSSLAQPQTPQTSGEYDEGRFATGRGRNVIAGHAQVAAEDGTVRTCRGAAATLIPAITATRARMDRLYGAGQDYVVVRDGDLPTSNPELRQLAKRARCDGAGAFRFTGVPDGTYFVTAGFVGKPLASVKHEVSVRGGETARVELTNQ